MPHNVYIFLTAYVRAFQKMFHHDHTALLDRPTGSQLDGKIYHFRVTRGSVRGTVTGVRGTVSGRSPVRQPKNFKTLK